MKYLRPDNHITFCGEYPVDKNDRENERTAIELTLPALFSDKAKACWDYLDGAAFLFEYKGRLVVTDEGLYLTEHGNGSCGAPYGGPRWVTDAWSELEKILEETYDDLTAEGIL